MTRKKDESTSHNFPRPSVPSASVHQHETIARRENAFGLPTDLVKRDYSTGLARAGPTDGPLPRSTAREIGFRHAGWAGRRKKVEDALAAAGVPKKRLERFTHCGGGCHCWSSPSEHRLKLSASYCRDRFCVPCGTAKGFLIASNLARLTKGKFLRFLTLTLRSFGDSLRMTLARLNQYLRTLQATFFWKSHAKGGAIFIEVKRGSQAGGWHVHAHVLLEGRYMPHAEIKHLWHEITRDSFIVHIAPVNDEHGMIGYVTKYVAKPLDATVFDKPADLVECIEALKGARLCRTFGTWRGTELEEKPIDPGDWIYVAPLEAIMLGAGMGSQAGLYLLAGLTNGGVIEEDDPAEPGSSDRNTS